MVDHLWPGGPGFISTRDAFSIGTDAILLSSFAATIGARRVCDLGCGSGVISILMALRDRQLTAHGVELSQAAAEIARKNVEINGLHDRVSVICGDLRNHRDFLAGGSYDLVVSNPPYYAVGRGKAARGATLASARGEITCTLEDIAEAARFLTKWGGAVALIHRPERLAEVIRTVSSYDLEPKRLRFIQYSPRSAPSLFLIECRRGGRPSLAIEPPLILTSDAGGDSDEIKKLYHRG